MKYEIEENVLKAILQYLQKQPYNEVVVLIQLIQQSKPLVLEKKEIQEGSSEASKEIKE